MTVFDALLLGLVQGFAEFLPVSSSGHLLLAEHFLGLHDVPLLFSIILHVATLAAVLTVFKKRIAALLCVFWRMISKQSRAEDAADKRIIIGLILATALTGIAGLAIKEFVSSISLMLVSFFLSLTGILLVCAEKVQVFRADKAAAQDTQATIKQSLIVGLAQGIGVIPGISRSGITIAAALLAGMPREQAGEFSFLLSIPAILGAFMLELKSADTIRATFGFFPMIVGSLAAFVSGYIALKFLLRLIKKGKLSFFAFYLIPAGMSFAWYFCFIR